MLFLCSVFYGLYYNATITLLLNFSGISSAFTEILITKSTENFAEITYDDTIFFGLPVKLEKAAGDTFVSFILEPSKEEKQFSLGHAQKVKRIPGAIFKER